jgi:hypothetical protein
VQPPPVAIATIVGAPGSVPVYVPVVGVTAVSTKTTDAIAVEIYFGVRALEDDVVSGAT